jgi:predicted metal-binding membrane protein
MDSTHRFPGGVPSTPAAGTPLPGGANRERAVFAGTVLVVLLFSWWWIGAMARDMYGAMTGPSAWMMTSVWDETHLLLLWTMWAVMMAAMMLPSAWPMLLMYGGLSRTATPGRPSNHLYLFAGGYILVWAIFSAAATVVQRLLAEVLLLSPMMELTSPRAAAAFLIVAGVYQLTPLKRVCLRSCHSPMSFLVGHWRAGARGALRMGIDHGIYCLGCCWALMLLLFVGGVMNLYVIAALATLVAVEKLVRGGEQISRLSGGLLVALALWILLVARPLR